MKLDEKTLSNISYQHVIISHQHVIISHQNGPEKKYNFQ